MTGLGRSTKLPPAERVFAVAKEGTVAELLELLGAAAEDGHTALAQCRDAGGCLPLHVASEAGRLEMVQALVWTGGDVRARDGDGWEPLHYSSSGGHLGTCEWLLKNGAKVCAPSDEGWQPLHAAVDAAHVQVARFLFARGASLRGRTAEGHEALHVAVGTGAIELVQWLARAIAPRENLALPPVHSPRCMIVAAPELPRAPTLLSRRCARARARMRARRTTTAGSRCTTLPSAGTSTW